MYLVNFTQNTYQDCSGKWNHKSKSFNTEAEADDFVARNISTNSIRNFRIFVPIEMVKDAIDYKKKFEELYDFILTGAGVRKVNVDKVMI